MKGRFNLKKNKGKFYHELCSECGNISIRKILHNKLTLLPDYSENRILSNCLYCVMRDDRYKRRCKILDHEINKHWAINYV